MPRLAISAIASNRRGANPASDAARRAAPGRRKMGYYPPEEIIMQRRALPAAALILACLSLGACRERNEPVKPIADLSASVAVAAAPAP